MSYIPRYILKRMIPPNSFFTVDKDGDGMADSIGFYIVNILNPITILDGLPTDLTELAKFIGISDFNTFMTVTIDGIDIGFDIEKVELIIEDKSTKIANLADLAGITIPLGGKIIIIYDYPEKDYPAGFEIIGEHELEIKYNMEGSILGIPPIIVKREITSDRVRLEYRQETSTFA